MWIIQLMLVTLNCDGFVQSRDVFQENGGSLGIHKVAGNPLFLKLKKSREYSLSDSNT